MRGGAPRGPVWRRWLLPGALAVVTVLVLVLYFSPLLGVREVRVTGGSIPERDVLDAAGVEPGTPMLRVDESAVRERLARVPAVADVAVELSWPSEVLLRVVERAPQGFLAEPGGVRLVDASGVLFGRAQQPPDGLPQLHAAGGPQRAEGVRTGAAVLAALPRDVHAQLRAVHAEKPSDIHLVLQDGRRIHWGDAAEMQRKAAILPTLLSRSGDVYDVTTPALPTVA
ncbi:FtsQ-type POTRA domain-containing protein [Saccharopolyspora sp. HNM0983]|uniref:FtsQ-type POTRA domain-containing protein n=1 Tax=Saccharopolyspora montiporae TaxID=2781240 RepID=A0A929FZ71_9PSEU|nr:FtsQ-type POTRA domain-containing protein [Saccharopolyspora sp. HNM0983]